MEKFLENTQKFLQDNVELLKTRAIVDPANLTEIVNAISTATNTIIAVDQQLRFINYTKSIEPLELVDNVVRLSTDDNRL